MKNINYAFYFILLLSTNISAQALGAYFSLGPGFNTGDINNWINHYQLGGNFGLEYKSANLFWRIALNAETEEGRTNKEIELGGNVWPNDIQINFMSVQFLVGYPIIENKFKFIIFGGLSGNWLTVPKDYEEKFNSIGSSQSTGLSVGPLITVSSRYRFWGNNYSFLNAFIDISLIHPMFDSFIDSKINGLHYGFKLGIGYFLGN